MGALLQPYSSGKQRHSLTVALFDCKYPQSMQNAVLATAAIRGSVEPQAAGPKSLESCCEIFRETLAVFAESVNSRAGEGEAGPATGVFNFFISAPDGSVIDRKTRA